MTQLIQEAPTARAKCRGCGERIAAGELRFGESVPNPFADGETTQWYHLLCGAYKRPEPFLECLAARTEPLNDAERLKSEAERGVAHRRLPRINGAERSPSGRAQCRQCREPVPKGAWRIPLVFFEDGRFEAAGFIHASCAEAYFETADLLPRLKQFSPNLTDQDLTDLQSALPGSTS
jgi:hypothetical protein